MVRRGLLRKSPFNAYVRLNKWMWNHLGPSVTRRAPLRWYGRLLHRLVVAKSARRHYFGTFFFRNRPQLALIRRLLESRAMGSRMTIAFLGCSNGAEVYSTLWTIRSARPDLTVVTHGVDICADVLELARRGTYSLASPGLVDSPIFARIGEAEMEALFDPGAQAGEVHVKPWLKEGIVWHLGDAASPELLAELEPQDMVIANNFLCHMTPSTAERCVRNVARLVAPGGYLFISGVDLDVRTRSARALGWSPVRDAIEDIHEGDSSVRNDWPCHYWGLEPFDKRRQDWVVRYASVFQLAAPANGRIPRDLRRPALTQPSRGGVSAVHGHAGRVRQDPC